MWPTVLSHPYQRSSLLVVAFHTPTSYGKLTAALEACGYKVHVPRMPTTNGSRPPNANFIDDSQLVRNKVDSLVQAGHTVITIGHSYGAHVMSNALYGLGIEARSFRGLKGGVSSLLYMAVYLLPEGMSTFDEFEKFGNPESFVGFDTAEDHTMTVRNPKGMFLSVEDDKTEAESYVQTLCRWNGQAIFQASEHAAWREIPASYIRTTQDLSISTAEQLDMIQGAEKAGREVQVFTATQSVVDIVNKLVSG
ncbi:hypothetical protein M406DRAFT_343567 [Cryphonectria parasitica EP155]|uniref:AB hydrolase-1 domain-containing protein n=1 Tax=Cryphonectria parasitica (strain ATCC 38755 / EP155) TaxID=660469 RepID=A0A9P4XPJ4_CRYP1|nr:uncharacterized protein M406DRAFT_343567 [Cryphonectria parasitica EP155]KAF3759924.1 hypothetical protein M406DRAFT_343567 [Cryphonectria parasitica EP155]